MARYIDADKLIEALQVDYDREGAKADDMAIKGIDEASVKYSHGQFCYLNAIERVKDSSTADVVPKSEVEKIFEKLKARECSNSVCAWCVHATDYGRRNEECDKPYIDKNGKEQKACYVYAKFESLIDNELAELKKKYTEGV